MDSEIKVTEALRESSWKFRTLEKKHEEFKGILEEMNQNKKLTPDQETQKKIYQKRKLLTKDTMVDMIRHYQIMEEAQASTNATQKS